MPVPLPPPAPACVSEVELAYADVLVLVVEVDSPVEIDEKIDSEINVVDLDPPSELELEKSNEDGKDCVSCVLDADKAANEA